MRRITLFTGIVCALLLTTAMQARAGTVLYDFENLPIGTETPFAITSGGVTARFSGPPDVDSPFGGAFGISSNFPSPIGFQYRLLSGDYLTTGSAFGAFGSALTINFSVPISGVTFTFALDDPTNVSTLSLLTNAGGAATASGALTSGFRYPEGTFSFTGAPFTTLTLSSSAIDFQLDNLRATAVPEPELLLLFGAGLGSFALTRVRRRRFAPI